jgi:integrase/recombinase XerD
VRYEVSRATSSIDGRTNLDIIDENFSLHPEASSYLLVLADGRKRSINTVRAYAGRVARFLEWADRHGVVWKTITLTEMTLYRRWLEETPEGAEEPPRGVDRRLLKLPKASTISGHLTATCGFLRFCAQQGIVEERVAAQLSEERILRHTPSNYDVGEDGQWRTVRTRVLKVFPEEPEIVTLTDEQTAAVLDVCTHARDRFLVYGLRTTGLRINEQLGLRRSDMHLLPSSRHLGCRFDGPHIHVVRREDNDNGALAKDRHGRPVPVEPEYVDFYRDYQYERDAVPEARDRDLVFVNLFHAPLGRGMTYRAAKDLFERLSALVGFAVRPHMLRHTFATALIANGAAVDVVRELLGHVALSSTGIYLHPAAQAMRDAIQGVFRYDRVGDAA